MPSSVLDREPLIRLWRPLYNRLLVPYVWPLFRRPRPQPVRVGSAVGPPPAAPAQSDVEVAEALHRIEKRQQELAERLAHVEGGSSVDWARLEELLVSLWADSSFRTPQALEELRTRHDR